MSAPADRGSPDTPSSSSRSELFDHYLETIFYIEGEGDLVRPGRIATWLGVSAPTVSATLRRLVEAGLIETAPDRSVSLSGAGRSIAADVVRTHRLVERWLTDALKMDWTSADVEAQRLAPGFGLEVIDRLDEALGHPATCPHGNVIPGREAPYGALISLATLPPDTPAFIRRISEVAEHDAPQLLRHLDTIGLYPGVLVTVVGDDREVQALSIRAGGTVSALGAEIARSIWVEPQA